MPKDIKTHETVKNVKTFDRAATVGDKLKNTVLKTKDAVAEQQPAQGNEQSPEQYAVDRSTEKVKQVAEGAIHQADSTGRKAVTQTKENVQKIKEKRTGKIADASTKQSGDSVSSAGTVADSSEKTPADAKAPKERGKEKPKAPKERRAQSAGNAGQPSRRQSVPSSAVGQENSNGAIKTRKRDKSSIKERSKKAERNIKGTAGKTVKSKSKKAAASTGRQTAAQTQAVTRKVQQTAHVTKKVQQSTQQAYDKIKKSAKTAKAAAQATAKVVKGMVEGTKALVNAIIAGGWTAVLVILIICMAGLLFGSVYGIFFSNEDDGSGRTMTDVVAELNAEYYSKFERIKNNVLHDEVVIDTSRGNMSIAWDEVLAVYAVKVNTAPENPMEVITISDEKVEILRGIMNDMNTFTYSVKVMPKERSVTYTDADGNDAKRTETVREVVLTISIVQKSAATASVEMGLSESQQAQVQELLSAEYSTMWALLLGGYRAGSNEVLPGDAQYIGTDIFAFPMQAGTYTISSPYGYRSDPFTGKTKFHGGLDLAAAEGTPILAAADGVVTVANATDSWGYGWGYYVKIQHNAGFETLYAHCSAIAVAKGQAIKQGQVIAYVGTSGNSTGNHLHFEVYHNGNRTNPMDYFTGK